ncbi:BolA family protein [Inmirania thermothiophila]|uniref:BolA protein family transcriptional regulator n=1 Tax=Inmirania thermothiophila TaxID=1750597 RepID=A0A3N1Y084_9GAMM|nr:BolA family protein [Inmirania thermothiophila]ROR32255.1 BolA protein family transcriptional regulator [Inmirania thermothiophila]
MSRAERIEARLREALGAEHVEVVDESHRHAGHAGARDGRGHFAVTVIAPAFAGRGLLERHRMVYDALGTLMQTDIHALSIRALAPGETGA